MNRMFSSAVFKLTAWYVGILALISLAFSLPVYIITSDRLERSATNQMQIFRTDPRLKNGVFRTQDYATRRQEQLDLDRQQLLNNIIFENILILVIGSIASYLFARRTLRPIEEAHSAQGKFTANASHQLRTPLATMQAEIDVALRDKKLSTAEARHVLQSNLEEIGRLRVLSDQLLRLTRIDPSHTKGQQKTFDAGVLAKRFVHKNHKIYNLVLSKESKPKAMSKGDGVLIEEALTILCENAYRYSGGKVVTIGVTKGRNCVRISVADHGPGMKFEEQERVFDRFYRGKDSAGLNPAGHGLGLSLAREIVERYEGTIIVKSKLGNGSVFSIVMPLA